MTDTPQAVAEDRISIPLSALEHYVYCVRQAALIHVEATWAENVHTVRGDLSHHAVDLPGTRRRAGLVSVRSMPVWSHESGLHGVCDLVEIEGGIAVPVEYKVGPYQPDGPSDVQLAGQALCLAEAGFDVPEGYVYSGADRRRHRVVISDGLLRTVVEVAEAVRRVLVEQALPTARNDARCRRCSLRDDCLPELTHRRTLTGADDMFVPRPLGSWHD